MPWTFLTPREAAASLVLGSRPCCVDSRALFGCLLQALISDRTVESARGTGRGRGEALLSALVPLPFPSSWGPAQVSGIQRIMNSSFFPHQPSHFLKQNKTNYLWQSQICTSFLNSRGLEGIVKVFSQSLHLRIQLLVGLRSVCTALVGKSSRFLRQFW